MASKEQTENPEQLRRSLEGVEEKNGERRGGLKKRKEGKRERERNEVCGLFEDGKKETRE